MTDTKKKEEVTQKEVAKNAVEKDSHIQTEGRGTHHDLLPEEPTQTITEKNGATSVEEGPSTEMGKKEDQVSGSDE